MGLSKLEQLYRQVILDHSSHPRHYGELEDATGKMHLNNPTCGDDITVYFRIEDDRIVDVQFTGVGCSISMASASMMTEAILGKTVDEAQELIERFSEMVLGEEVDTQPLGDAALLQGVSKFPARIKCATLGWKALEKGIQEEEE